MGSSEKTRKNESCISKKDAIDILDRIIGFINSCDNKASIILGVLGVILTIIFLSDGIKELKNRIQWTIQAVNIFNVIYLFILFCSFLILFYGIYKLVIVLRAKIDCLEFKQEQLDLDSKIFFNDISRNKTYKEYKQKLQKLNEDDMFNDIISQIYINSKICKTKYDNYNIGLSASIFGLFLFMLTWGIGVYICKF